MDRPQEYNVVPEPDFETIQEMELQAEEAMEDQSEDQMELSREQQELYGSPEPDEKHNQHSFLHKSTFDSEDTLKMTFLTESELGRPLFSVRFLGDMRIISHNYIDPILKQLKLPAIENKIARYFLEKRENVTASGLSNKGFIQNLNATRKIDTVKRRFRENMDMKGGKK